MDAGNITFPFRELDAALTQMEEMMVFGGITHPLGRVLGASPLVGEHCCHVTQT